VKLTSPTLRFILAWTFLNVLVNLNYPARELHGLAPLLPSPEVTVLMGGLCAAIWLGMPFRPIIYSPLTALMIFFRLFRLADVLVPMYFNRDFNLYIDSWYVPDLIHLLYNTVPIGAFIGYFGVAAAFLIVVACGVWWAFKAIHRTMAAMRQRHLFLALVAVLLGLLPLLPPGIMGGHPREFSRGFFHRVVGEIDFILHVHGYRTRNLEAILASRARAEQTPASLDKLRGANVYVFFIESYGHTVFANPSHFSMIAPLLGDFEKSLENHGFAAYSSFVTSPTYGGTSWLAHGSFASGVPLTSQMRYDLLVTSDLKMLAHYFNEAGYRTISVMPGTTWPWPEGEVFGYQKKYYAWNFDYKGPKYGWSPMPDQYVLDYIYRQEIRNRKQPLFIEYVLITSHAPFHRQPPYLEDWSQIGDGTIFHKKDPITFPIVWPDLSEAGEAYMTSIAYEFKVLKTYLERSVDDGALVIILGDHQPNPHITGEGQPWSVPIHVISRNQDLLEPFAARGYTSGVVPSQPLPHHGMETFLYGFLHDFSTPPRERVTATVSQP
jgi:hypothetical protein